MVSNTLEIIKQGDLEYIQFPKLKKSDCVRHIFSTRKGGVSQGDASSMNVSFSKDISRESVLKNYDILCSAVGINPENLVLSHQTHTNNVIIVDEIHKGTGISKPHFCDVDGMITAKPGVALMTQYADCTPLVFCDPVKKIIATSHAGWRGTVALIGKVTVEKMIKVFGCDPRNIIAGIGPCIGQCCYEVDDPVIKAINAIPFLDTSKIYTTKGNGKYMLNLTEANRQILINAGLDPQNIDVNDICTCCNCETLHSHRATKGKRGNLGLIIELV